MPRTNISEQKPARAEKTGGKFYNYTKTPVYTLRLLLLSSQLETVAHITPLEN